MNKNKKIEIVVIIIVIIIVLSAILLSLKIAYGQTYYNTTTGNYIDDPDNPTNADTVIIKYCIDHADAVAVGQNVIQNLVNSGMVPSYYDGKTCQQVGDEHIFNKMQQEGLQSIKHTFGID